MMQLKEAVGDTLRRIRTEQGKSMRQVVRYISVGHLSEVERGEKEISGALLYELCKGLNITPADFLMEVATYMKENEYV